MKSKLSWWRDWAGLASANSSRSTRRALRPPCIRKSVERLETRQVLTANEPFISEFLADNKTALADEDGDFSDWIEVHNPTGNAVNLNGWYLTDNRGNLTKWQFPDVSVPAGGYEVVFASDKNRRNPSGTLHTNFKLGAEGEYLALVKPDRTIANEFQPAFPAQQPDVSYGLLTETKLVHEGSLGDFLVPTSTDSGSLATWMNSNFMVDARWRSVATGVGFGLANPGFNVRMVDVDGGGNHYIDSTSEAENVINGNFSANEYTFGTDISTTSNFINFPNGGTFGGDTPYPNGNATQDLEDIIVRATATVTIPAGNWMIGFGTDDGGYLRFGSGITFSSVFNATNASGSNQIRYEFQRGHDWTVGQFTVPAGGITTTLDSLFYERGGGDTYEIAIRPGFQDNNVLNSNWQLLSSGTFDWAVNTADTAGAKTDVASSMKNINATSWLRVPFDVANAAAIETLMLRLRYNDGFIAYLNGTEIARRNAPNTLAYNSVATATRSTTDSRIAAAFDITAFKNLLTVGSNVLAIQGLNVSSGDSTFIIAPELVASGLNVSPPQYFATPTPGAINQQGFVDQVKDTSFSVDRGFFEAPFTLAISTATAGATIRYTTDGSTPSETNGTLYSTPLTISQTTVLRARAFKVGFNPSDVDTQTYLFLEDVIHQSPNEETPPGFPATPVNNQDNDYGMDPAIVNDAVYGPQLKQALKALPTISIVTDTQNLFDQATGIYVNPYNSGIAWERPTSVELINSDGTDGFQIDAGLRIRGGFSRSADNPKHALRLFFRSEYGESKLRYPLFGQEGADEFDAVDLRTAQNYSWSFGGDPNYTFTRDIFSRDTQRDMGDPYTRGRYYHLYIDGQYWGLYQTQERSEADFGATYFGGKAEDYDVVKVEAGPYTIDATDGNLDAWQRLWTKANAVASATTQTDRYAIYQEIQGLNTDGTENLSREVLLDVDNLIDYMNVIFYGGNLDAPISVFLGNDAPNNWYGIRSRINRDGFRFFAHDSEHTLLNRDENRTGPFPAGSNFERSSPQWIHQQLMFVDEYRLRFADRVQELYFNNGLLTPQAAAARMQERANQIQLPVIAESARWGDSKRSPGEAPLTQADWLNRIDYINNEFFPQRTANVIAQYKVVQLPDNEGLGALYPSLAPPEFNIAGGAVTPGLALRMSAPVGQIYYTLDGSDPRLAGGAVSPAARAFNSSITTTTFIARGAAWKYRDIGDQGSSWRETGFNDSGWSTGNAQLGYGDGDEATVVNYGGNASQKHITTYFRKSFNVSDPAAVGQLTLHVQRDDGAVIYLNGHEIARTNMPDGDISFGTLASGPADENSFYEYTIDSRLLVAGNNVLAVEVHQSSADSSDISFNADLIATAFTGSSITLNQSQYLRTRTKNGAEWSALNATRFFVNAAPSASNFAITELNYNPLPPTPAELAISATFDRDAFEFIELQNTGTQVLDLPGVRLTNGVTFDFTDSAITTLAPGQRISVVSNLAAFRARYGNGPLVAGQFTGSLSDNGERLTLLDRDDGTLNEFSFDDSSGWPDRADGLGSSLEVLVTTGDYNSGANWRSSTEVGGSPSAAGVGSIASIVINEVLTHTDLPQVDSIELFNPTSQAIDVSGWFLSDTNGVYDKYRIPNGTVIPPLAFRVFNESQFNVSGGSDPRDFRLDGAHGDNLWLVAATNAGKLTQFIGHVDFGAARNGESFGRWADSGQGSNATTRFYPMSSLALGAPNSGPRVGPVVISEIMYAPPTSVSGTADDLQFIEIYNPTNSAVDLTNWRIRGGIDFDFAASTSLPANGKLVIISFNPTNPDNASRLAAFRTAYGINASVPLVGGYSGQLSDSGESVRLLRPDEPPLGEPLFVPGITEDAVDYASTAPWPMAANAGGRSLTRRGFSLWGHDATSWSASLPTPGSVAAAQTLVSLDGSGNLLVQDVATNGQTNAITIDFVPATNSFSIRDNLRPVTFVTPTGVQVSANEVRIPRADITGSRLLVQAGAGNDSVTVDLTGGLGNLAFDIRGQAGVDELLLSGTATAIAHRATGLTSGEVASDMAIIGLDSFDFVTDTATATTRRYEIDGGRLFGNISLRAAVDPMLATRTAISLPSITTNAVTRFVTPTGIASNPVTIAGGAGNDTFTIASLASNYVGSLVVIGNEGNDVLDATTLSIRVSLVGGAGNDQLIGGSGPDTLQGGDGNDSLDGKSGDDWLTGGAGVDTLTGGVGTVDMLYEVVQGDAVFTSTKLDMTASNVTESDFVSGFERAQLLGSGLANRIDASMVAIPVSLFGGAGNDTLLGGSAGDNVDGQAGNDFVTGGDGNDSLNGGVGNDTLRESKDQNLTLTNTTLVARIGTVTQTTDTLLGIEFADLTGGPSRNRLDLSGFTASLGTTISGGGQSDTIIGSPGPDSIFTLTGADSIQGLAGSDFISAGSGNDTISGGDGADNLNGQNGDDSVLGDAGNDVIVGGAGIDTLIGGNDNDFLSGQTESASLSGGDGNDTLQGNALNDTLSGDIGDDQLLGLQGDDLLNGGDGADKIFGGPGNDTMNGGAGSDALTGEAGNDTFDGGADSDRINETIDGNATIVGTAITAIGMGSDTAIAIERINLSGGPSNNLFDARLASLAVGLAGFAGNDTLLGSAKADLLDGGDGDDVLSGGGSNDLIDGGAGTDYILEKADTNFTVNGVTITSTLTGTDTPTNIERIVLIGGVSANKLDATAATVRVVLIGGKGNDTLLGGSQQDTLSGGNRNDSTVAGGDGTDSLNGGDGSDVLESDPLDSLSLGPGDTSMADVFTLLPTWIDSL